MNIEHPEELIGSGTATWRCTLPQTLTVPREITPITTRLEDLATVIATTLTTTVAATALALVDQEDREAQEV